MYHDYDALIFDMDGTLVDSGKLHEHAWTGALRPHNIPVDRALMRSLAGVPTRQTVELVLQHNGIEGSELVGIITELKEQLSRQLMEVHVKPTTLVDIVKQYHGKKPMAVGTGASTAEAISILKHCGLLHYIDHVVGADLAEHPKPAPDTFLLCAQKMGIPPQRCIVFEDAALGIRAAKSAKMAVIDVLETYAIANDYFL
ncbi:MAG: beta-phosphoglucomutase family hydrolase [Lentisphaeria bacterium]|jgi:beta-phosphoglucomutase family hydrolase